MRCLSLLAFILLLGGCSSTEQSHLPPPPVNLTYHPELQAMPVESMDDIFNLNSDMKAQLNQAFASRFGDLSATKRLIMFLLNNGDKSLRYQSGATLTAQQTYNQLNANCLSLSILAFSMAEHLGLEGEFQRVHIPEYWALDKGYNLLTGHINLKLRMPKVRRSDVINLYDNQGAMLVDFAPDISGDNFKTTTISKERVAAMFYNNKGAAALVNNKRNEAFSYFLAATQMDPSYSGGWGNLGILFRVIEDYQRAEQAYDYALLADANNNTAAGNLAILYQLTGRQQQAQEIEAALANKRKTNPYYQVALGNEDIVKKQYSQALAHFRKARELDGRMHESYFGLARTYYLMGDIKAARKHLTMAHQRAQFKYDKERYRGKLAALNLVASNR
ncbi:tetratricopeptide repeat protein [Pseudoalteromonas ruthenica]|uniref:tetratricopeptide repeat protein n=1 Tax=Pseudoalteromonas ruthenica TaxID=151081 RepID=UPI0024201113|nr:tetratricopeptide repeat protein [Pseudoalteromonas ruthenica]|tara:strand:+ start:79439 stop:80608 length:1170 start_codon:yes stop_codon:yes gene_type:complete